METIWFCLWILLWAVYFTLDGFDLGMGTLMPFLARNATERRIIVNAQGPYWDGNEVWLLTAGGATFAAFLFVLVYISRRIRVVKAARPSMAN